MHRGFRPPPPAGNLLHLKPFTSNCTLGTRTHNWEDHPGIEFWSVKALLRTDELSASVVIATASLCRVDLQLCTDLVFELDCIGYDLGVIASAIRDSEDRLNEYSIAIGLNSSILIAEDVVVDRFWRGNRLGPALVFYAADTLRADGIFLTPGALSTRLNASGVCVTNYNAPRPGPPAQKKVETAWRKAGFQKLVDDVVFIPTCHNCFGDGPDHGELARETITKIENLSNEPRAKAWLHRRARRQSGSAPASALKRPIGPRRRRPPL
jgi:hypothetical protein